MFFALRSRVNYWYFRRQTRDIYRSAPMRCDPGAACEVHTMLRAIDVPLYLLAVKSLLRYTPPLAVIIYSDGTLEGEAEQVLRRHLPGCRVVSKAEADERARAALGAGSFLHRWRDVDISYRRLMDTELWSAAPKRIIMDSDVLTVQRPDELIDWIAHGTSPVLLGQAPTPEVEARLAREPAEVPKPDTRHVQQIFVARLRMLSERLGMPDRFLHGTSAGFYACGHELSLPRIERLLHAALEVGIPMHRWGGEQCIVIYLLTAAGATRLDPERHFNFGPRYVERCQSAAIVHFFGTHRFYRHVYTAMARRVAGSLAA
ncbi:MAG TPA: hypothetical protein VNI78_00120 [Vicinamibacterales bacterium]|nr:hypothetical protein [Vicinamibacterales bacterium]